MEDKKLPLWNQNAEIPNLRRPMATPDSVVAGKEENKTVVKHVLSADAPEWFPPNYKPNSVPNAPNIQPVVNSSMPRHSVQDRLRRGRINDSADRNYRAQNCTYPNTTRDNSEDNVFNEDSPDIIRLKQLINTLTNDPGQFDNLLDIFTDTLYPYFGDPIVLYIAAELLVNQAICETNFRYTAAKLCCHIEQQCPEFRGTLHVICEKELNRNANKPGVVMFVAELYTQLHHENLYGGCLIDAFKQLLSEGGNDNVKYICQALKLTGCSLELYDKQALDDVFDQLQAIKPTIGGTALSLLNTVINLRNSQWGQSQLSESDSEHEGFVFGDATTPVFYSEGYKLTSEESEFLAANINTNDECLLENDSDPDELCDPEPEMDEEIQAAFREFVQYSKR